MKTCDQIHEWMSEHIDGALDDARRDQLVAHLAQCPSCRQELAELKQAIDTIHTVPEVDPPADLLERIHDQLARESRKRVTLWNVFSLPQMQIAVAATLLLAVGIFGIIELRSPKALQAVEEAPSSAPAAPAPSLAPAPSQESKSRESRSAGTVSRARETEALVMAKSQSESTPHGTGTPRPAKEQLAAPSRAAPAAGPRGAQAPAAPRSPSPVLAAADEARKLETSATAGERKKSDALGGGRAGAFEAATAGPSLRNAEADRAEDKAPTESLARRSAGTISAPSSPTPAMTAPAAAVAAPGAEASTIMEDAAAEEPRAMNAAAKGRDRTPAPSPAQLDGAIWKESVPAEKSLAQARATMPADGPEGAGAAAAPAPAPKPTRMPTDALDSDRSFAGKDSVSSAPHTMLSKSGAVEPRDGGKPAAPSSALKATSRKADNRMLADSAAPIRETILMRKADRKAVQAAVDRFVEPPEKAEAKRAVKAKQEAAPARDALREEVPAEILSAADEIVFTIPRARLADLLVQLRKLGEVTFESLEEGDVQGAPAEARELGVTAMEEEKDTKGNKTATGATGDSITLVIRLVR